MSIRCRAGYLPALRSLVNRHHCMVIARSNSSRLHHHTALSLLELKDIHRRQRMADMNISWGVLRPHKDPVVVPSEFIGYVSSLIYDLPLSLAHSYPLLHNCRT